MIKGGRKGREHGYSGIAVVRIEWFIPLLKEDTGRKKK
jgi:hypothetical protein